MSWFDLRCYNVPSHFWKQCCDYFSQDIIFKNELDDLIPKKSSEIDTSKLTDKDKFLCTIWGLIYNLPFNDYSRIPRILLNNKCFVLLYLRHDARGIKYVSELLRLDKEVVLAAVENNPEALADVEPVWKQNREVVLTAIRKKGTTIGFADNMFRRDRELGLIACKQNADAYRVLDAALKMDRQIICQALRTNVRIIKCFDESICSDYNIMLEAGRQGAKQHMLIWYYVAASLKRNPTFVSKISQYYYDSIFESESI